jgi:hypothetical protein
MRGTMRNRIRSLGVLTGAVVCFGIFGIGRPSAARAQNGVADTMPAEDDTMPPDTMPMDSMVVDSPPPPIPTYDQPPAQAPGYMWTPGYWAWGEAGYFWVPGAWVLPPTPGLLWTPGYWCASGLGFIWSPGYWGVRVGFYGGINYGFGYFGRGYAGGRWYHGRFFYNTAVTRVNTRVVTSIYVNRSVMVNNTHVSYNGGRGGILARPTVAEQAIRPSRSMTSVQVQHQRFAAQDRNQLATVSHNRPAQLATDRPFNARTHPVGPGQRIRAGDRGMTRARGVRMGGRSR